MTGILGCSPSERWSHLWLAPPGQERPVLKVYVEAPSQLPGVYQLSSTVILGADANIDEARTQHFPSSPSEEPIRSTSYVIALTSSNTVSVLVEGLDAHQAVAGRAYFSQVVGPGFPTEVHITLQRPCHVDTECEDAIFCNGHERCNLEPNPFRAHFCDGNARTPACPVPASCAHVACVESAAQPCVLTVNHAACPEAQLCDPSRGCEPGRGCVVDADCDDGDACDGMETCVSWRCQAGTAPPVADTNDCTLDYCDHMTGGAVHIPYPDPQAHRCGPQQDGICQGTQCVPPSCGDGRLDPGEACDNGTNNSATLPNRCRLNCALPSCGDGVRDDGEQCDDHNTDNRDSCLADCTLNQCGDGFRNPAAEACDDGNTVDVDGCLHDCTVNTCGDGFRDPAQEECDDANANPNDGCWQCQRTQWGASVVAAEQTGGVINPFLVGTDNNGMVYVLDGPAGAQRLFAMDPRHGQMFPKAGNGTYGSEVNLPAPATAISLADAFFAVSGDGQLFFTQNLGAFTVDGSNMVNPLPGVPQPFDGVGGPLGQVRYLPTGTLSADPRGHLFLQTIREVTGDLAILDVDLQAQTATWVAGGGTVGNFFEPIVNGLDPKTLHLSEDAHVRADGDGGFFFTMVAFLPVPSRRYLLHVDAAGALLVLASGFAYRNVWFPEPWSTHCQDYLGVSSLDVDATGSVIFNDEDTIKRVPRNTAGHFGPVEVVGGQDCPNVSPAPPSIGGTSLTSVVVEASGDILVGTLGPSSVRRLDTQAHVTTLSASGGTLAPRGAPLRLPIAPVNGLAWDPSGVLLAAVDPWLMWVTPGGFQPAQNQALAFPGTKIHSMVQDLGGQPWLNTESGGAFRLSRTDGGFFPQAMGMASELAPVGAGEWYGLSPDGDGLEHTLNGTHTTLIPWCPQPGLATDGPFSTACLCWINNLVWTTDGNLLLADDNAIRKVDLTAQTITTLAGTRACDHLQHGYQRVAVSGDQARFGEGMKVVTDHAGGMYVGDPVFSVIYRLQAADGGVTVSPWGGAPCGPALGVDGGSSECGPQAGDFGSVAQASLRVQHMVTDGMNGLYVVGGIFSPAQIRRIDLQAGTITTVVGPVLPSGDGDLPNSGFSTPQSLMPVPPAHGLLVADRSLGRIRRLQLQSMGAPRDAVDTVVGYPGGAGTLALQSDLLEEPWGLAWDPVLNTVYISQHARHVVTALVMPNPEDPATWYTEPFAGLDHIPGNTNGPALQARFNHPAGLAFDAPRRRLLVADQDNHVIRSIAVDVSGQPVTDWAGRSLRPGYYGEEESPSRAFLRSPSGVMVAPEGSIYIADTGNHRIRRVRTVPGSGAELMATVLGDGSPSSAGSGSPATLFPVNAPTAMALDSRGNLFVPSREQLRVVTSADGTPADGRGTVFSIFGMPPRQSPLELQVSCLSDVMVLAGDDRVWMADACRGMVVQLTRTP